MEPFDESGRFDVYGTHFNLETVMRDQFDPNFNTSTAEFKNNLSAYYSLIRNDFNRRYGVGGTPFSVAYFAQIDGFICTMKLDLDRLRARAAHYRREAARAKSRDRLVYCRALATHLTREASELERILRSNATREPELSSAD